MKQNKDIFNDRAISVNRTGFTIILFYTWKIKNYTNELRRNKKIILVTIDIGLWRGQIQSRFILCFQRRVKMKTGIKQGNNLSKDISYANSKQPEDNIKS
jgi:hypothetical protein